jgi:hypothetical protein
MNYGYGQGQCCMCRGQCQHTAGQCYTCGGHSQSGLSQYSQGGLGQMGYDKYQTLLTNILSSLLRIEEKLNEKKD